MRRTRNDEDRRAKGTKELRRAGGDQERQVQPASVKLESYFEFDFQVTVVTQVGALPEKWTGTR